MKTLGLVVSEKIFFSHCKFMGANNPRGGAIFTQGAWLAGFIKRTITHCCIQNNESSRPCCFGEEYFLKCFSHDAPREGPVWTPGARLVGFIKWTTIHCYTQNMKALGLVVSEIKIFFYAFSHCKSMGAICLPWKPEFLSDLDQNLMQPFSHPNDASFKI